MMMKQLIKLFYIFMLLAVNVSCSESEEAETVGLKLSQNLLEFTSAEGIKRVTIKASGEWTAKSSQEWCTTKAYENDVAILVKKNYLAESRQAEVTISSGKDQAVITVTQAAGKGVLEAFVITSTKNTDLPKTGSGEISLSSNKEIVPIKVSVIDSKCSWYAAVIDDADFISFPEIVNLKESKSFNLVVSENPLAEEREAKIKFWSEYQGLKCEYVLTLKQAAGEGILNAFYVTSSEYPHLPMRDGATLTASYRKKDIPLQVVVESAEYKWSVEVVDGVDVVSIPELKDCEGSQKFTIAVNENPTAAERTAKIRISSKYHDLVCDYDLDLTQQLSQYTNLQVFAKEDELKVMSFNVYVDVDAASSMGWPNRKEACFEMIRYHRPALIGMQETMYSTSWTDLYNTLKKDGYDGFAIVRADGSQRGNREGTGILYDTNVLTMGKSGNFWLSNPSTAPYSGEVGRDWFGAQYMRVANWAIFTHKETGKTICYINTHLDLRQPARVKEMEFVMQKFEEFGADCDYWISTADYNAYENSDEMKIAYDKLKNARSAAPEGKRDYDRTYNGGKPSGGGVIDHVLCSKDMEVVEYHTIDDDYGNVAYLSDHYPVYAIIKIK